MPYVIIVEFRTKPGEAGKFEAFIKEHSANSRKEPWCLAFDVCRAADDENLFLFYEVYRDEQGYLDHRAQPSWSTFNERVENLIVTRDGKPFQRRSVLTRIAP